jgi:hypothetical protein
MASQPRRQKDGFSLDGLVNRLRIGSARLALEARDSPAIYIVFDMLANSENLLGSPFRLRRKTLERFFENPPSDKWIQNPVDDGHQKIAGRIARLKKAGDEPAGLRCDRFHRQRGAYAPFTTHGDTEDRTENNQNRE